MARPAAWAPALFREAGLAHTRFAADEHQAPLALAGLVKPAAKFGSLVLPRDVRCPGREHRSTRRWGGG